jgi:hypothetical protein
MIGLAATERETPNPLDRVERLAERRDWTLDRTNDHEVTMVVASGWSDLNVALNWRDDLEALHLACSLSHKVPEKLRPEVSRLLAIINAGLFHGHFDLWMGDGSIVFRNSLVLAGGAEANDDQCEAMIRIGLETCERYFPAIQFVIWAGKTAEEAMESSLFETMGEA